MSDEGRPFAILMVGEISVSKMHGVAGPVNLAIYGVPHLSPSLPVDVRFMMIDTILSG